MCLAAVVVHSARVLLKGDGFLAARKLTLFVVARRKWLRARPSMKCEGLQGQSLGVTDRMTDAMRSGQRVALLLRRLFSVSAPAVIMLDAGTHPNRFDVAPGAHFD